MTIDDWFTWATADATQHKVPGLKPLLEGLRGAMRELRAADWNDNAAAHEANEQAAPKRPAARKLASRKADAEQSGSDKPGSDKPAPEKPTPEKPAL